MSTNNRRYSIKFSGVTPQSSSIIGDPRHDGKMDVKYCYMFAKYNADDLLTQSSETGELKPLKEGKIEYSLIFPDYKNISGLEDSNPLLLNYVDYDTLDVLPHQGLLALEYGQGNQYSIYRREYGVYERPGVKISGFYYNGEFYTDSEHKNKIRGHSSYLYVDNESKYMYQFISSESQEGGGYYQILKEAYRVYKGDWEPVALKTNTSYFRDYNISNDRSYQYIMYPKDNLDIESTAGSTINNTNIKQVFANFNDQVWIPDEKYPGQGKFEDGSSLTSHLYGAPVRTHWEEWSIIELEPLDNEEDIPVIKHSFKANIDQLWLFKYSLETGSQTQNITRNEFQTLGQFPKFGFGNSNYVSGEVTALLGSEIIPYTGQGYIERLRGSRDKALSTNEKTKMLEQWRKLIASKNPKLLRDMKGQSWIVQITGSSNSPKNFYKNQPDTISFSWKQIMDPKNVIIYGDVVGSETTSKIGDPEWKLKWEEDI